MLEIVLVLDRPEVASVIVEEVGGFESRCSDQIVAYNHCLEVDEVNDQIHCFVVLEGSFDPHLIGHEEFYHLHGLHHGHRHDRLGLSDRLFYLGLCHDYLVHNLLCLYRRHHDHGRLSGHSQERQYFQRTAVHLPSSRGDSQALLVGCKVRHLHSPAHHHNSTKDLSSLGDALGRTANHECNH